MTNTTTKRAPRIAMRNLLLLLLALCGGAFAANAWALSVSLTAPASGAVFQAGSTISLTASATPTNKNRPIVRVQFFRGTTLIGTDTTSPYSFSWTSVPAGSYSLTAKATDSTGATATSSAHTIKVNAPPTVSLTAPASGAIFSPGSTIPLAATASDSDGTVSKVDFLNGATVIGTDTTSPYSFNWTNVASGTYTLTARATDSNSGVTTSGSVTITVDAAPTVSITAPANNAVVLPPANVTVTANAADSDGTVSKVDFFDGATLVGTATAAPFSTTLSSLAVGTHTLSARATDNAGLATTSAAVTIRVDTPPTVSLTAPANNSVFASPANITLSATAADSDGTVSKVDFFDGATLVGTASAAPYSVALANVAAGTHLYTARATDNNGAVTTSAAASVTVDAPPAVTLTAPTANAILAAPGPITLSATATDAVGTITKVDFFQGTVLIGTATTAPYNFSWSNVAPGNYSLTAVATNDAGGTTTSAAVPIKVDAAPVVNLTAPAANAILAAPGPIALSASATDAVGTIAKVDFFQGAVLIGTATAAPFNFNWTSVAPGNYSLTAVATNDAGSTITSAAVPIKVDAAPTVSMTAPASNAVFAAGATVTLSATPTDSVGTITKVDFYQGANLVGTATTAPYSFDWVSVVAGSYSLTAVATNDAAMTGTSGAVSITVDAPPAVALTAPASGASFTAPANIPITASASDAVGNLTKVDFYQGSTLIGTATTSPYNFAWTNVGAGTYSLTAIATNDAGTTSTSAAISVTVKSSVALMYFIHPDHLNTPRMIADQAGTTVWRNDNAEPFGDSVPNGDPGNTGIAFDFPLRFPGQYFDRETGLHYNYYRYYDPNIGRYDQSDLVGLLAGVNTYAYVRSHPLSFVDKFGLDRYSPCTTCTNFFTKWVCKQSIDAACKKAPAICCDADRIDCLGGIVPGEESTPEQIAQVAKCTIEHAKCMAAGGK